MLMTLGNKTELHSMQDALSTIVHRGGKVVQTAVTSIGHRGYSRFSFDVQCFFQVEIVFHHSPGLLVILKIIILPANCSPW